MCMCNKTVPQAKPAYAPVRRQLDASTYTVQLRDGVFVHIQPQRGCCQADAVVAVTVFVVYVKAIGMNTGVNLLPNVHNVQIVSQ